MVRLQVAANRARGGRRVGEPPRAVLVLAAQAADGIVLGSGEAASGGIRVIEDEHPQAVATSLMVLRGSGILVLHLLLE